MILNILVQQKMCIKGNIGAHNISKWLPVFLKLPEHRKIKVQNHVFRHITITILQFNFEHL